MKESLKGAYSKSLEFVSSYFKCETLPVLIADDNDATAVREYVEYTHTTQIGNTKTHHYLTWLLRPTTLDVQNDFHNFLTRYFVTEMADAFRTPEDKPLEYLINLFKHFVCDNDIEPKTLSEIKIADLPRQLRSQQVTTAHSKESNVYTNPTKLFNKEYENWHINKGFFEQKRVTLNGVSYPMVRKDNLNLGIILKKQNLEPVLRALIKLWIIHQVVTQYEIEDLKNNDFFNEESLDKTLENLQTQIQGNLVHLLQLLPSERIALAQKAHVNNRFTLSPFMYQLSQRIAFVKLFTGLATYDIHQNTDPHLKLYQKWYFYFQSYINLSLSIHLLSICKRNFIKAKSTLKKFSSAKKNLWALCKGYFRLILSLYTLLWLPFIAAYFAMIGITSLPFSILRKVFRISFGGLVDKILTGFEAVKDLALGSIMFTFSFNALSLIATTYFPLSVTIGSSVAFYTIVLLFSPILIWGIIGHFVDTYPRWERINGVWVHKTESDLSAALRSIGTLTSHALVGLHSFIAFTGLIGYSTVAFVSFLIYKLNHNVTQKLLASATLVDQKMNLNHSAKFKKHLNELQSKLATNTCSDTDKELLVTLTKCQLNDQSKKDLQAFMTAKVEDTTVVERSIYRIALTQIHKETYLPSWKLVQKLHNEVKPENAELKTSVEALHQIYSTRLASIV
ncbi:MAG: hypothetical protein JSS07_01205 [Proteobacteria bacterium]|nr:hypothetical protein [Pseudomonadota bacterium]